MLALLFYLSLGGSFIFGQAILCEVGRYELWDKNQRLTRGFGVGGAVFLISSLSFLFEKGSWTFPFVFFFLFGTTKLGVRALNSSMPERFQPTGAELKQKYSDMFKVNSSEIEELLKGELEFIEKLGMNVELPESKVTEPEEPQKKDSGLELGELRKAIRKFLERDEKWE